jgi:hypothetical protein
LIKGGMGSVRKDQFVISIYEAWKFAGRVDYYRLKNGIGHEITIALSPNKTVISQLEFLSLHLNL